MKASLGHTTALRSLFVAALALALAPTDAEAHLVTTGLGPVFDGIGHLFLTPEDLLPALALALFAGLRGAEAGRSALFVLPAAWLAGGLIGLASSASLPIWVTVASFLIVGGLVAADARLSRRWLIGLAVVLGLLHGSMNGAAMAEARLGLLGLLGITAAVFVLVALAAGLVVSLRRPWTRIAVRVAGSWIVATGLLLLGWWLGPAS
ncbi:MAG: HupE/UreJ family protein [Gemmatimonadota bacterium]|nr:MAG: HupE/UreJ family protein [Gemmatimonadota bacterium]